MDRILPKLELRVILMYFMVLPKTLRPMRTAFSRMRRSLCRRMMSADSLAMSTAVSTDTDTSAAFIAGASLIPSPI